MRKILPALFLVASCAPQEGKTPDPQAICTDARERSKNETDDRKKLFILEEAVRKLGNDHLAFELQRESDRIHVALEKSSGERSAGSNDSLRDYDRTMRRLQALKADDEPRGLESEVRDFIEAYGDTVVALNLRLQYRAKLLDYRERRGRNPISWGEELPESLAPAGEDRRAREAEAILIAQTALEEVLRSPVNHSRNIGRLNRALAQVSAIDPTNPFAKKLKEAIADQKGALDRQQQSRQAEKAMTDAVNRADGKGARALVAELEAIEDRVAKTRVEPLWREHLEDARRRVSQEKEREELESRARAVAGRALTVAEACGLDYEKALGVLRSALDEVEGTEAAKTLKRRLRDVSRKSPKALNSRAGGLLKAGRSDEAIGLLRKIAEQEDSTGRIAYSGGLAFRIGKALAKSFSPYEAARAQERGFTSTYDEAVHYFIYAASRNADADGRLLKAAELLLEMKLKERARKCLEEAAMSPSRGVAEEARKRLERLNARPEE